MKKILLLALTTISLQAIAQNVGVGVPVPLENLHVDSTLKVGKNQTLGTTGRKNLIKFGDANYLTIGEEKTDDKLYIRFGDLSFLPNSGSVGNGYIGVNVDTATAQLDVNGSFRLRGNGAEAGKVLTSDALGNATWKTVVSTGVYSVGSLSFRPYSSTTPFSVGGGQGGASITTATTDGLSAPVHLPQGAQVTKIVFGYYDNVTTNLKFKFVYENTLTSSYNTIDEVISTGAVAGWRTIQLTFSSPITINNETRS